MGTHKILHPSISRRDLLIGMAGAAGTAMSGTPTAHAAPPEPTIITPALIDAARKEGKVSWYTSVDLAFAETVAKAFSNKFPGISLKVEKTGSERMFQRIGQEIASRIFACDVVESSDAAHFIVWKRDGLLAPHIPEDVAHHYAPQFKDEDGTYAVWRVSLVAIAYNTRLVKAEDAPRSFVDLLDPKWTGKLVKSHPSYGGSTLTATQQMARDLGWGYFENLAKQKVMQVTGPNAASKKVALGERAIAVDASHHVVINMKEKSDPIEIVYASEGTPLIFGPAGIMKSAPHPNAARLFHSWMFTREAQQINVDAGGLYSGHSLVIAKPGRIMLKDIKTMREDPFAVAEQADEIKARYAKLFGV
jgi:iron(III) transport system substrate-binding protein